MYIKIDDSSLRSEKLIKILPDSFIFTNNKDLSID